MPGVFLVAAAVDAELGLAVNWTGRDKDMDLPLFRRLDGLDGRFDVRPYGAGERTDHGPLDPRCNLSDRVGVSKDFVEKVGLEVAIKC
jgi:hypothetical protein